MFARIFETSGRRRTSSLHTAGRLRTGETRLILDGVVAGVDPATGAVDVSLTADPSRIVTATPQPGRTRPHLRVGQAIRLEAATSDIPASEARVVRLVRVL